MAAGVKTNPREMLFQSFKPLLVSQLSAHNGRAYDIGEFNRKYGLFSIPLDDLTMFGHEGFPPTGFPTTSKGLKSVQTLGNIA